MSDNQSWNSTGEQIKDALSEALKSGNFSNLNSLVSQTVTNTLNEVGKEVEKHISFVENTQTNPPPGQTAGYAEGDYSEKSTNIPPWQKAQERAREKLRQQEQNWQRHMHRYQAQPQRGEGPQTCPQEPARRKKAPPVQKAKLPPVKFKRIGNVSNVLYQVFGGIGLGITGLFTCIHLMLMFAGATVSVAGWIVNFVFLLVFFGMIQFGIMQKGRLKRAERYLQLCDRKMYGDIEKLARGTGRKVRYVIRDIQKMLHLGMFPEGHLDEKKTCLMLNDAVYRQYLETEENHRLMELAEKRTPIQENPSPAKEDNSPPEISREQEAELNAMIAEGMECISKLNALNERIPGEIISAKLSRLEGLLKDIFDSVREHPEQMHRMHKLMDYYLPTTLKLVEAYEEFDRVSAPGEDIIAAKAEIENTLDTINQAFTELLNNLFQDAVFDATTDAQVLKTMLAREGLTNDMKFS